MGVRTFFPALAFGASFPGLPASGAVGHASEDFGLIEGLRSIPLSGNNELLSEAFQFTSNNAWGSEAVEDKDK